ncbi:hypothetical protein PTNB85_02482 [Pyrenophora teres f. teres]|nr:hypothetical protein PTNB85_02482 [Pyrenophora teres f. teres]KAE8868564.1 hypothetical protein PTNB29_02475 [Pyrenophora teres f. teres]
MSDAAVTSAHCINPGKYSPKPNPAAPIKNPAICPVGKAAAPINSDVKLELDMRAEDVPSDVVVLCVVVALDTTTEEKGAGADEGASVEGEDSMTMDEGRMEDWGGGAGADENEGGGSGTSDTVSAELLDGGSILVGGNATLDEGRGVLVVAGGASLLGSGIKLETGTEVGGGVELCGGGAGELEGAGALEGEGGGGAAVLELGMGGGSGGELVGTGTALEEGGGAGLLELGGGGGGGLEGAALGVGCALVGGTSDVG